MRSFFFFSSRRRHTRFDCDWSSDVCSSDLVADAHVLDCRRRKTGFLEDRHKPGDCGHHCHQPDRKSTRLNSSHSQISYAVFCLKKKKNVKNNDTPSSSHPSITGYSRHRPCP